jgi:hypothetical protein
MNDSLDYFQRETNPPARRYRLTQSKKKKKRVEMSVLSVKEKVVRKRPCIQQTAISTWILSLSRARHEKKEWNPYRLV